MHSHGKSGTGILRCAHQVAIDAAADEISALAGKPGSLPGVSARTVFSRRNGEKQA